MLFADHRFSAGLRIVVLGLACVSCWGCRQTIYWYHPDKTLAEAERDCRECLRQAQVEAAEATWEQGLGHAQMQSDSGDQQWSHAYQDAQFRRCMRRNGYQLVPERELEAPTQKRVLRIGSVQAYPIAGE
jgi:hypothetical protein